MVETRLKAQAKPMTEEQTAQFVRLYRDHECLWNVALPEYRNRDLRSTAFHEIVDEMGLENFTTDQVANKIKIMRCTYHLEVSKIEKHKRRSMVYRPSMLWFPDMKYLMDKIVLKNVKIENNLENVIHFDVQVTSDNENPEDNEYENLANAEIDNDDEVLIHVQSPPREFNNNRKYKMRKRKIPKTTRTTAKNELKKTNISSVPISCQHIATTVAEDECDIMGKQIAMQLRSLPEHMRLQANFEIQRILMDYRIKNMDTLNGSK